MKKQKIIKERTHRHKNDDLTKHSLFEHTLDDGSKIITVDKTWCWECPFMSVVGTARWTCSKFPFTQSDIGDWYDGPLRRIECMKQTGDYKK